MRMRQTPFESHSLAISIMVACRHLAPNSVRPNIGAATTARRHRYVSNLFPTKRCKRVAPSDIPSPRLSIGGPIHPSPDVFCRPLAACSPRHRRNRVLPILSRRVAFSREARHVDNGRVDGRVMTRGHAERRTHLAFEINSLFCAGSNRSVKLDCQGGEKKRHAVDRERARGPSGRRGPRQVPSPLATPNVGPLSTKGSGELPAIGDDQMRIEGPVHATTRRQDSEERSIASLAVDGFNRRVCLHICIV
jgi:hypothetical protein